MGKISSFKSVFGNDLNLPTITAIECELNSIFAPAVASVTVTTHSGLTMAYANGQNFVHGGSGWLSVYNADQKTAIQALTDAQDDVYYLLFVDNATKLDENDKPTIVAGYMPVNSQFGFIFTKASHTEEQISRAIAHELGHGAFHLWHTFSTKNDYQATQGSTTNLMDYTATTTDLYKYQWDYIHNPEAVLFRGDDEEGESLAESPEIISEILETIRKSNEEKKEELVIRNYDEQTYFYSKSFKLCDTSIYIKIIKASEFPLPIQPKGYVDYEYSENGEYYTTFEFFNGRSYDAEDCTLLHITVKSDFAELLKSYLFGSRFEEIDLSDKVQWISQFDDIIKRDCNSSCCWYTCNYILQSSTGHSAPQNTSNNIAVLKNITDYNDLKPTENFDERVSYMKEQLKLGNPVVVGVHRNSTEKPYNTNEATRHFVVVVGMGYDEAQNKNYFRFYEVGTTIMVTGTNVNNRLYLDSVQRIVSGYTTMLPKGSTTHPFYTITEIRTNK